MTSIDENKLFSNDNPREIFHYVKKMREIKADQDYKKAMESVHKKKAKTEVRDKYNNLSDADKNKLYESWLSYFPLARDAYEEYMKPLTSEEKENYLNSKVDTMYYELFNVFGNPYQFSKIFYDDPLSKKIQYPYSRHRITDKSELQRIALKKVFQMYLNRAIDNYRLESSKDTELYNMNRIENEKRRIILGANRLSRTNQAFQLLHK